MMSWLKLVGQKWGADWEGADAKTVTQALDLAGRAGNRGNLGRVPLEPVSLFKNRAG